MTTKKFRTFPYPLRGIGSCYHLFRWDKLHQWWSVDLSTKLGPSSVTKVLVGFPYKTYKRNSV